MKTASTLVAVCIALVAGVSAAPVENAAAAVENTGPKDLSHPHWKKPIPTWSHRATRTLEVRSPKIVGPSATAGPPGPSFPGDGELHWGAGYTISVLTEANTWYGRNTVSATPRPTILACDGRRHPDTYSYDKCVSELQDYQKNERKKKWDEEIKHQNEEEAKQKAEVDKVEMDKEAGIQAQEKKKAMDKQKQWEKEMEKAEADKKKAEMDKKKEEAKEKKKEKARKKEEEAKEKAKKKEEEEEDAREEAEEHREKVEKARKKEQEEEEKAKKEEEKAEKKAEEKEKAEKKAEEEKAKAEAEAKKNGEKGERVGGH